ncbi:uncharacterized protein [Linepithema humile]|uniref:uncharacterized protein n=1 Tax=Linepithema humile TaxID=83485 RepID=UPI000623919C|nr:PREDICTED: uncharacterized protein LOC105675505 [Linepithema humile]
MLSRVSLLTILLILNCVSRAMEHSKSPQEERAVTSDKKVLRHTYVNVTFENLVSSANSSIAKDQLTKMHIQDEHSAHSKIGVEERDRPRGRKRRMDRTMMALLMAYKLKFVALIPTLLGGLILLKGTTLLAGFFFALFAAVLGLKGH